MGASIPALARDRQGPRLLVALDKRARGSHLRQVKPGDHPEFFRFPAPEGRSRESTIRLDGEGTFFHDDEKVEHAKLAAAMHAWIARHPDDGRYILTNGYDWTYFKVDDVPYFVRSVRLPASADDDLTLVLSDATEEPWQPEASRIGTDGAIYTTVKRDAKGGPFEAKFSRHAQVALAPVLVEDDEPGAAGPEKGKRAAVSLKNRTIRIGT